MTHQPYSYVVIRYVPDSGAGEGLNIGVAVYSESARFLSHRIDSRYERLSNAFGHFDGPAFRRAVLNLVAAFRMSERSIANEPLFAGDRSFEEWLRSLMPDTGASLAFTSPRHGMTEDLEEEVLLLYDRMVESQKGHGDEAPRRDDAQVWRAYASHLSPKVSRALTTKSFETPVVKVEFAHAVKNGAWHVIQPVSMDFKRPESIQRKASQWVGTAVGLYGTQGLGSIFFLLGQPSGHRKAYERAKALLSQAPGRLEIIEEDHPDALNRRLLELMEHVDE